MLFCRLWGIIKAELLLRRRKDGDDLWTLSMLVIAIWITLSLWERGLVSVYGMLTVLCNDIRTTYHIKEVVFKMIISENILTQKIDNCSNLMNVWSACLCTNAVLASMYLCKISTCSIDATIECCDVLCSPSLSCVLI